MPISFDQIAADTETPGTVIEFNNTRVGASAQPQRALLIGQKLTAGTVAQNLLRRIDTADQAGKMWGRGSHMHDMAVAFKAANKTTELWGIALDDGGSSVAAAATLTITGPATGSGSIYLLAGGKRIVQGVTSGQANTAIATALAATINALTDVPFTAGVASGVVTLTAKQKGTLGNQLDVRLNYYPGEELPAGVGCTISAFASGATDPDVATVLVAIAGVQYNKIACALSDAANLTKVEAELSTRFGPDDQIEGRVIAGIVGAVGAMSALGQARNSPFSSLMGNGKSPTSPWVTAAAVCGVDALDPDPARPRQNMPLPRSILAPAESDRPIRTERNALLKDGVSTFIYGIDGSVSIEVMRQTYKLNTLGLADRSYKYPMTIDTLGYIRYDFRAYISQKYPRAKLAKDGTNFDPGQVVVTPSILTAEFGIRARAWEKKGLVQDVDTLIENAIFEINADVPDRVDFLVGPELVKGFRMLAGQIRFS
jgi:phage tail sheath gpL-like